MSEGKKCEKEQKKHSSSRKWSYKKKTKNKKQKTKAFKESETETSIQGVGNRYKHSLGRRICKQASKEEKIEISNRER